MYDKASAAVFVSILTPMLTQTQPYQELLYYFLHSFDLWFNYFSYTDRSCKNDTDKNWSGYLIILGRERGYPIILGRRGGVIIILYRIILDRKEGLSYHIRQETRGYHIRQERKVQFDYTLCLIN